MLAFPHVIFGSQVACLLLATLSTLFAPLTAAHLHSNNPFTRLLQIGISVLGGVIIGLAFRTAGSSLNNLM